MKQRSNEKVVNCNGVLLWDRYESHNFSTVSIYSHNVCNTKHDTLLVLVKVKLFSKISGSIWNWIEQGSGIMVPERILD